MFFFFLFFFFDLECVVYFDFKFFFVYTCLGNMCVCVCVCVCKKHMCVLFDCLCVYPLGDDLNHCALVNQQVQGKAFSFDI